MKFERTIGHIKDISERIRVEMQSIPRSINPQNVVESIEVILKFMNSIIRIKSAIKIIEAAEKFDIPPRDKIQIQYYKEVLKEYMTSIYNSCTRVLDLLKNTFSEESFERIIFTELENDVKEIVKPYLPAEILGTKEKTN